MVSNASLFTGVLWKLISLVSFTNPLSSEAGNLSNLLPSSPAATQQCPWSSAALAPPTSMVPLLLPYPSLPHSVIYMSQVPKHNITMEEHMLGSFCTLHIL